MNSEIKIFQKGFNYSQDGPGNRLVYHLCGCNLKCPWCSNPEGMRVTQSAKSICCDEIVREALSAKPIFIDGGGVTFTGGEVTCQKKSLLTIVKSLRKVGINTCIETNASLPDCDGLFEEVDFMIADFKTPHIAKALEIGADIENIKRNLIFRAASGKPLLVRVPLIHYFNCGEENAAAFGEFFSELQKNSSADNLSFEILTYHEFGKSKYKSLNIPYTVTDGFVTNEDINLLADEIKRRKLNLINT